MRDLLIILRSRDALAAIESRLPEQVRNLADAQLDGIKALLDASVASRHELLPFALVLVRGRLAAPWQLIRLAVRAAQSDDAARIAVTPYAAAVNIVLADIERMVGELKADLKGGVNVAVTSLLKCIHDAARGVRAELDLPANSSWGRQLAAIRGEISNTLKTEMNSVPGRVRRLLRPRPTRKSAELHARSQGRDRNRDVDRTPRRLPQLRQRARHQRNDAPRLHRLQHFLDTSAPNSWSTHYATPVQRPAVPQVATRCRGALLRKDVRAGIRFTAHQGRGRPRQDRRTQGRRAKPG